MVGGNSLDAMTLSELVAKLHDLFSADEANTDEVQKLMEAYDPTSGDWKEYATYDAYRYTRNLVDSGNGKFNLILLCWGKDQRSSIHDHAGSHCWLKVVDGDLEEHLYGWPEVDQDKHTMKPLLTNYLPANKVAYIHDKIGLHRVQNSSRTSNAASLHLYSPPFDACQTFDELTGKSTCCRMRFWTKASTTDGKQN